MEDAETLSGRSIASAPMDTYWRRMDNIAETLTSVEKYVAWIWPAGV